jgi:hypothetical protein
MVSSTDRPRKPRANRSDAEPALAGVLGGIVIVFWDRIPTEHMRIVAPQRWKMALPRAYKDANKSAPLVKWRQCLADNGAEGSTVLADTPTVPNRRRRCQQVAWVDRSRIGVGETPYLPHERHVDAADMTVEDEGRFHAVCARYDASDCGVVFAAAPSYIPVRTEYYHAAGSDVAVVRRECFCVVGAIEDQVVSGSDLDIALDLNFSDELSRECAADSDDPCALGTGSPYAGLVFALSDDARAAAAACADYAGCLRPVAVVAADDGAVIGRMPHTSHSLALCTLPENALPSAVVGTDDGAVIG